MRKIIAILFGIALLGVAVPYALADSYRGPAHICSSTGKVCADEMPSSGGTLYLKDGLYAITATNTSTSTASATTSGTGTSTGTGTLPSTQTLTFTGSNTATSSMTFHGIMSWTQTQTGTAYRNVTVTGLYTGTVNSTLTITGNATVTRSGILSATVTTTAYATVTGTSGATATATVTGTTVSTSLGTSTQTASVTASNSITQSNTYTGSITDVYNESGTGTGTAVQLGTATVTGTVTINGTATATGSFTGSATTTATFTGSASGTAIGIVTDTSSSTATSATVVSNPTIGYVAPATNAVPGGDLFLGANVNTGTAISLNTVPYDSLDWTYTLTAGGSIQSIFSGGVVNGCDGAGGVYCTLVTDSSANFKWVSPGTIQYWIWAKSTSPVTLTVTVGLYNGTSIISTIDTFSFSVTSASMTLFTHTYALANGLVIPGTPWALASQFQVQDLAAGTPTIYIGTSDPHRTRINGPWIQSGAKP